MAIKSDFGTDETSSFNRQSVKPRQRPKKAPSLSRSVSREFSRRRSSLVESLPETPQGWAVLVSALASVCLGYEINLQKALTCPPSVYGQIASNPALQGLYKRLTRTHDSILSRNIQPSLFVGTNSALASGVAYALPHCESSDGYLKFGEILRMTNDGAQVGLDWELPAAGSTAGSMQRKKNAALHGPLDSHVVIILHGINNNSSFGYIQALCRACTRRGWAAIGMNFRGCGGVPLSTPRPYNGGYTGDVRCVVRSVGARLVKGRKIFVVGNSLGANVVTKYFGEEGLAESLPEYVAGGISLGNPMIIDSENVDFPFNMLLSLGMQRTMLEQWKVIRQHNSSHYRNAIRGALTSATIAQYDEAVTPIYVRNNPYAPFETKIGYPDGPREYFRDASSFQYVRFVSVPFLVLTSEDDFLVKVPSTTKLAYCLSNPNIMVVQTKCGGHLGWQEMPPDTDSMFGIGTSWADTATTDFISAVLDGNEDPLQHARKQSRSQAQMRAEVEASAIHSRL